MERILDFFIKNEYLDDNELCRKGRLFVLIIFISLFFSLAVILNRHFFGPLITYQMVYLIVAAIFQLFYSKYVGNYKFLGNFYAFNSWISFTIIIVLTGGVMSSAFQWLLVSIIPAYIFTSQKNGHLWFAINFLTASLITYLSFNAVLGLMSDVTEMELILNAGFSLSLLTFIPILVLFYSYTNEEIKSNLKNLNFDLIKQEKQVKQSEQKFRAIAENFPNGSIAILDWDYRVLEAYGEVVDKNADIVEKQLSLSMLDILGEEEFSVRKPFYDIALSGKTCSFESYYNGEYFFNSVSPYANTDGKIDKIVIASQVITDIKLAEKKIQESQYILRKIIDTAPVLISRIDKDGYYQLVNVMLSKLLGIPCDEAEGMHINELVPENVLDSFKEKIEFAKANGQHSETMKVWSQALNKDIYNHYIINTIENEDGEFDGVVVIGVDITEQVETEQALRFKNTQISQSINYATRIQNGILGPINELSKLFKESFIFFRPKDILSGDFFWCRTWAGKKIVIAGDCTGHGVPGALMTIIGLNFINEIVLTYGMTKPDMILQQLDQKVTTTLLNSSLGEKIQDGMDMSIIVIDEKTNKLEFAGAKNPLYICRKNGYCERIRGSKYPIGSTHYGSSKVYHSLEINIEKGDVFYLYTDGFQDQMGGHNGKKYMAPNFRKFLEVISKLEMDKQNLLLGKSFDEWKVNRDQTDDVLVMGIRY